MRTPTLKGLKEATIGKARQLNEKIKAEGRDPTAAEQSQIEAYIDAYNGATGENVPKAEHEFAAFCSAPERGGISAADLLAAAIQSGQVPAGPKPKGYQVVDEHGKIIRALGKGESFANVVREQHGNDSEYSHGEQLQKDGLTLGGCIRAALIGPTSSVERAALSGGSSTGGGYTVPTILAGDFIDKFRVRTRMFEAGAAIVPLGSGDNTFAKLTGDATASWRQELKDITESGPTFGAITMTPRSLAVIVRVSRELLQDSQMIGRAVERSLTEAFAAEIDRVGMLGSGAAAEPLGVANDPGINVIPTAGQITNYSEMLDAYKLLLDDNAPDPTAAIMSNREWRTYAGLTDTTNQPLQRPKAIENLDFLASSGVPTNAGGGANESTIVLGHFPDFVFGMRAELTIEVLKELYAKTHEIAFVAHLRMDTGCFHPESFCKITGITP
ncbi:phage major capsid protein [Lacipirellula sp.]|uniref:phage major capsid protein n=1 Tax=Lacipirellula sp. TaxID=2691419 RepID=UPI003D0C77A0